MRTRRAHPCGTQGIAQILLIVNVAEAILQAPQTFQFRIRGERHFRTNTIFQKISDMLDSQAESMQPLDVFAGAVATPAAAGVGHG
jgi:hypothetical protein